jgi:hypothetical protein
LDDPFAASGALLHLGFQSLRDLQDGGIIHQKEAKKKPPLSEEAEALLKQEGTQLLSVLGSVVEGIKLRSGFVCLD